MVLWICPDLRPWVGMFGRPTSHPRLERRLAPASSQAVAADIDRLILADLDRAGIKPADRCLDADFLRRVSLDITGQLPSPRDVTIFVLDPEPNKRTVLIDQLLRSPEYGKNWARYWRDVIYMPATQVRSRISQADFEKWMTTELNDDHGWDRIVSSMLTATGDVHENPATALIFAQSGQASEIAAEACRVFLGIQMQCANCHDHPSDVWKRTQFHELAAYFPRISLRQKQEPRTFEVASMNSERGQGGFMRENPERFVAMLDRNNDGKLSPEEMKGRPSMPNAPAIPAQALDRMFQLGDTDKDGACPSPKSSLSRIPNPARRGSIEHHMPDLNDPVVEGKTDRTQVLHRRVFSGARVVR